MTANLSAPDVSALDAAVNDVLGHLDDQPARRVTGKRPKSYVTALPGSKLFVDHSYQRTWTNGG